MARFSLPTLVAFTVLAVAVPAIALPAKSTAQSIEHSPDGLTVHSVNGTLHISVCSERVIHVVVSPTSEVPPDSRVPVMIRACGGTPFTQSSVGPLVSLKTRVLTTEINLATGSLQFVTPSGQVLLSEKSDASRPMAPAESEGADPYQVRRDFLLSPQEAIYGLGQHQEGFLDLRSIPLRLLQANTNIAIPFLISTKGYGLLWNNAALTDFNPPTQTTHLDENGEGTLQTGPEGDYGFLLTGNGRDKLHLTVDGQSVIDLKNMWLPWSASGKIHLAANTTYKLAAETGGTPALSVRAPSDTMGFASQAGKAVDYYFLYGPSPSQVIAEYREFTGTAPLLPLWAYGFWQCRERYASQQQILDTAAEFRNRKIPVDVLVQDWQYWGKYGWNAMRFDESNYPDPAEMMSALHRQNVHLVISVWAKFGSETAVNREMEGAHLELASSAKTGETNRQENWADLFNPTAQKTFWSDIDRNLFRDGVDGWWLDASEPEGDPLKDDDTFLGPGKTVRNAYPLFETSAVYKGQRATTESKRVVILSRSAYAGQQRNGSISWSGDISANWETLRRQIPAGLSFEMSGMPYWTTDIGGFFRPADQYTSPEYRELLVRWFEFGSLCPIFRIHGYQSETEMWKYGPEVERILREYDGLRYRLLPYIYSAAWGVTSRGKTLMQALPLIYPNDLAVRDVDDEFLFGDSILVSPVTQPDAKSRRVVLPSGDDWVDFWTGQAYHGGQIILGDAPLDRMPLLVKQGSIVPMGPAVLSTAETEDPVDVRIYAGKDADFELYEDAGDGYAYEQGARATIPLHWNESRKTLSIGSRSGSFPGMPTQQTFRIVLVRPGQGLGTSSAPDADFTVQYDGSKKILDLGTSR